MSACVGSVCEVAHRGAFDLWFVMPGMVAMTDDMNHPLFLRKFGVPFWALALVFGRNHMFWYRAELALGRFSPVG